MTRIISELSIPETFTMANQEKIEIDREGLKKFLATAIIVGFYISYQIHGNLWMAVAGTLYLYATEIHMVSEGFFLPNNPFTVYVAITHPHTYLFGMLAGGVITKYMRRRKPGNVVEHTIRDVFATIAIDLIGTNIDIEYVGPVNFNQEVMDEYGALRDVQQTMDFMSETWKLKMHVMYGAVVLASALISGAPGALTSIMLLAVYHHNKKGHVVSKVPKITHTDILNMPDGMYRLTAAPFGAKMARGMGYISNGTMYTRYHVTSANPIDIGNGIQVNPCYINKETDNVAYGRGPVYGKVNDGDEVLVAVGGPRSNNIVMYRTKASVSKAGLILFKGNKTIPGTSGSPVFKEIVEDMETETGKVTIRKHTYVGCTGWYWSADPDDKEMGKSGTEMMAKEPIGREHGAIPMEKGEIRQLFRHPGAGKTRTDMPVAMREGLNLYGKVYLTGPSKVVCNELYLSLKDQHEREGSEVDVSLITSDATPFQKAGSRTKSVIIGAHAHMLALLTKNSSIVRKEGLWIMDEAHYVDSSSMSLKDELRSLAKNKKITLLEMTATGYDLERKTWVFKKGSNFHIEDIRMSTEAEIIDHMLRADGKVIVFATSILGKERTSSKNLAKEARRERIRHVELNSKTFATQYKAAREMETGIIITTDIAECGANFGEVDTVYDFQKSPKPIATGKQVSIIPTIIDEGQMVQRRGRTGRVKEGSYINMGYNLREVDLNRVEHLDRALYAKCKGLEIMEPSVEPPDLTMTEAQVAYWKAGSDGTPNSPYVVNVLLDPSGLTKSKDRILSGIIEWTRGDEAEFIIDQTRWTVAFWDDRDTPLLKDWIALTTVKEGKDSILDDMFLRARRATPRIIKEGKNLLKGIWDPTKEDEDDNEGGPSQSTKVAETPEL